MPTSLLISAIVSIVPLFLIIAYNDVRYRRIPNPYVLAVLVNGLILNSIIYGVDGFLGSLEGTAIAFALMFVLHVFGAMGAGDVKLFGAVGSVIGAHLVLPTFVIVVITGGMLAIFMALRRGTVRTTMWRVLNILAGFMPGARMPRYEIPADRRLTIPYGVAITLGSLMSFIYFSHWKH
ncbi:MAG TPA: prepilin peptidase [Pyrinomonadaceae bacterium]|nr:prepilin peptidase [Pyrinomonadaceae bacterium]